MSFLPHLNLAVILPWDSKIRFFEKGDESFFKRFYLFTFRER